MLKERIKIIILLFIFSLLFINVKGENNSYSNGDIKCPDSHDGKCEEIVKNGKVVEVRIKEKFDDISVTKIVSKSSYNDKFNVKFIVDGPPTEPITIPRKANIVVIFDKSYSLTSVSSAYNSAKNATVDFSDKFKDQNLALIVFANDLKADSSFSSKKFNSDYFNADIGTRSRIDKAFKKANQLLDTIPEEENKYVVVFGDGKYWHDNDTCREENVDRVWNCKSYDARGRLISNNNNLYFEYQLNLLKKHNNLTTYAILYKSNSSNTSDKNKDKEWMQKIATGDYFQDARSTSDYSTFFQKIEDSIKDLERDNEIKITAKINDIVGSDFHLSNGSNNLNLKQLGESDTFEISLNDNIKTANTANLWHKTNNSYKITIKKSTGEVKEYNSSLSAEVYWKNTNELTSCSDLMTKSNSTISKTNYFSIQCMEGYDDVDGVKAVVTVNNLTLGTNSFSIGYGMGFPSTISINNNIRCVYNFNYDKFVDDYNYYNDLLNKSTNDKDKASYTKKIMDMNTELNNYTSNSDGSSLSIYKDKFVSQSATMNIKYYSSKSIDEIVYQDKSLDTNIYCQMNKTYKLDNLNNIDLNESYDFTCTFNGVKTLELPYKCINIKTALAENCDSSSKLQLNGGNNYYVDTSKKGGYISINIPSVGYFNTDIYLDGTKKNKDDKYLCSFNMLDKENIIYRQIDVSDPFVKSLDNSRSVGNNYLNNNYNFINIIDSNIWNRNYMFKYQLSKQNVSNIIKSTSDSNSKVDSYLGTNCYITDDNKYYCPFTRNTLVDDNTYFFSDVKIND